MGNDVFPSSLWIFPHQTIDMPWIIMGQWCQWICQRPSSQLPRLPEPLLNISESAEWMERVAVGYQITNSPFGGSEPDGWMDGWWCFFFLTGKPLGSNRSWDDFPRSPVEDSPLSRLPTFYDLWCLTSATARLIIAIWDKEV